MPPSGRLGKARRKSVQEGRTALSDRVPVLERTVPANFPGLGFEVPLRFFSQSDVSGLTADLFENLAMEEVETAPGFFAYYVADRESP